MNLQRNNPCYVWPFLTLDTILFPEDGIDPQLNENIHRSEILEQHDSKR